MHDRKLKMLGMGGVAMIVFATLVMLLWNALLPEIFGIKSIGFFQSLGLLILSRILFGGIAPRGFFGRHGREMRERWLAMSQEERNAFLHQRGFGSREEQCGHRFHRGHFSHRHDAPRQGCCNNDAPTSHNKPDDHSGKTE